VAVLVIVDPALAQDPSAVFGTAGDLDVVGDIGALMTADLAMDVFHGFGVEAIIQAFIHR